MQDKLNNIQLQSSIDALNAQCASKLSLNDQQNQSNQAPPIHQINNNSSSLIVDHNLKNLIDEYLKLTFTLDDWNNILTKIFSTDIAQIHYAIIGIRKLLSIEYQPPIQLTIDSGMVPMIMQLAKQHIHLHIKLQALWSLTNICSGTTQQAHYVVSLGGIPLFLQSLSSPKLQIAQQSIWAIGNLAGDNPFFRDLLISHNAVDIMAHIIGQNVQIKSIAKNGLWALGNLCRGKPQPKYQQVKNGIQLFSHYIAETDIIEDQVLIDCLWALSYPEQLKDNLEFNLAEMLVLKITSFLNKKNKGIVIPSLRILSNLFENQPYTHCFLKNGGMDQLYLLLSHHAKAIRRQTCFVIQRITDVHNYDVQQIFANPNLIPKLFEMFQQQIQNQVKTQIGYIFVNLKCNDNLQKIYTFYVQSNILRFYLPMLKSGDAKVIKLGLFFIQMILQVGNKYIQNDVNMLVHSLEQLGGVDLIEKLQMHPNNQVYSKALNLLEIYFNLEGQQIQQENNNNDFTGAAPC